jgi:hypothetical protein
MRQARNEFGDDVMLVTSRIASPEFRYLGDYEVVFAVDGSEPAPETQPETHDNSRPKPLVSAFSEFMRQQFVPEEIGSEKIASEKIASEEIGSEEIGSEKACSEDPSLVISRLKSTFIDLGIDPTQAEVLVALIRSCTPSRPEPAIRLPELEPPKIASVLLLDEPVPVSAESPAAFEIGAVELDADIPEPLIECLVTQALLTQPSVIQPSVVPMPTEDEPKDLQVCRQAVRRKSSGKSGFTMMLVALGLFGMFRPVRTSK